MNIHIELVKKWLADNDSVTFEELKANKAAARDAYLVAVLHRHAARSDAYWAAVRAAYWAAAEAAYWAYKAAYWADDTDEFEHYKQLAIEAIARYEELTK